MNRQPALRVECKARNRAVRMAELFDFTGKVVSNTGGSTGIGRATALSFARQGARVVVGNTNEAGAETVEMTKRAGSVALFVTTDVSDANAVKELVRRTRPPVETYGGLQRAAQPEMTGGVLYLC